MVLVRLLFSTAVFCTMFAILYVLLVSTSILYCVCGMVGPAAGYMFCIVFAVLWGHLQSTQVLYGIYRLVGPPVVRLCGTVSCLPSSKAFFCPPC